MWMMDVQRSDWIGLRVDDRAGLKIGTIRAVLIDPETDLTWLRVQMGRFVRQFTLVPLVGDAYLSRGRLIADITAREVRAAPRPISDAAWRTGSFRSLLYRHYGVTWLPRRRGAAAAVAESIRGRCRSGCRAARAAPR